MSRGIRLALIAFPRALFVETLGLETTLFALATTRTNLRGLALALLILRAVFIVFILELYFPDKRKGKFERFCEKRKRISTPTNSLYAFLWKSDSFGGFSTTDSIT
jgi:hypothetical protein